MKKPLFKLVERVYEARRSLLTNMLRVVMVPTC